LRAGVVAANDYFFNNIHLRFTSGGNVMGRQAVQNVKREHFLVVKKSGFSSDGKLLSAREGTMRLLDVGFWPLWKNTRCKNMIEAGNSLLFYISGEENGSRSVIARAKVESVEVWTDRAFKKIYPLMLDGEPDKVMRLANVHCMSTPVSLLSVLDSLSFIPENRNKSAMMGGVRSLTAEDYVVLKGDD